MNERTLPWIVLAGASLLLVWQAIPRRSPADRMRLEEFGKIPVVNGGRTKPMDSLARSMMRVISDRETFKDDKDESQPAVRWLIDVLVGRGDGHKVFRIPDLQLQNALKLERRERYRYAMSEFSDALLELKDQVDKAQEKKEKDAYEKHLLQLVSRWNLYQGLTRGTVPNPVPPADGKGDWQTLREAQSSGNPNFEPYAAILRAYLDGDAAKFNEAVSTYLDKLGRERSGEVRKGRFESYFNHVDPFNLSKWLYFAAFVLSCLAWLGHQNPLNRSAYRLLWLVWIFHTVALVGRIYLSGRPPVTNLYSSAVFIGWACVLLALVFERVYRLGVGNTCAAAAGLITLQIAHVLAADGDTMEVLQAVLDTQFWLATHVTSITVGYSTTYVAGLIGVLFILRGVLTRSLTPELRSAMARMMYGATCFATFFSFVGTVLGGLWADDSWGRFWGWDPKENGALMIVLWNALILHSRWGGLVRDRGLAVLCVVGNVVVSWSWFGVNLLSVGLHNYGFVEGHAMWLKLFVWSQILVIGAGLLPAHVWRSAPPDRGAHADKPAPLDA